MQSCSQEPESVFSACSPVISLSVLPTTVARTAVGYPPLEANARIIKVDFQTKVQKLASTVDSGWDVQDARGCSAEH